MKLKCFFGLHNWEYSNEEVEYAAIDKKPDTMVLILSEVRFCPTCFVKEFCNLSGKYKRFYKYTKEQNRIIRLNELLK